MEGGLGSNCNGTPPQIGKDWRSKPILGIGEGGPVEIDGKECCQTLDLRGEIHFEALGGGGSNGLWPKRGPTDWGFVP